MEISTGEVEILVGGLLRYEGIAKVAVSWLLAEHFDQIYPNPMAGLLWSTALCTLEKSGELPKTAEFTKQLFGSIVAERFDAETAESWRAAGGAAIDAIFATPSDTTAQTIVRQMLDQMHQEFVFRPQMTRAAAAATAAGNFEEFNKVQAALSAAKSAIAQDKIYADPLSMIDKLDTPLDIDEPDLSAGSRLLTGTVLDALHEGRGVYRGLMSLILGPTSGGKTTLAHNLIAECCTLGHSVGLVSTEEDLEESAMAKSRILAAASGVDTNAWDAAGNDARRLATPLTAAQIDRIKKVRSNTVFYSFKSTPTFEDLSARIETSAEQRGGRQHDIVIVDWAGPLAKVISASTGSADHVCLEDIAYGCQELAKKTGIAVFLLHQLAAEQVKKSQVFGRYTEFDSQNCRKMAGYSGATYILTPADKQMRLRVIGAKLRADVKNFEIVAQLDPTHSKLAYLESMTMQGASFRDSKAPKSAEAGRAVPAVRKTE